jgi:hypothetical protein
MGLVHFTRPAAPVGFRFRGSQYGVGNGRTIAWTAHDDEFRLAIGHELWQSNLQKDGAQCQAQW